MKHCSNVLLINTMALLAIHPSGMATEQSQAGRSPNIIYILTDDQGYGDLACHGNPWLKTPNMDRLYTEGVRFSNFHVGTTCAPSRAGLLTGQYPNKVGVWHTIQGRQTLRESEPTLADILRDNGFATGLFGKWHLGENYPFRPQDRGFSEVLIHGGGGIGQTPDYWNNSYFNDTYFRNGKPEKFDGYCTDVFFSEAIDWMKKISRTDKPFFCFISTNAPHSPFHVSDEYANMYRDNEEIVNPEFYGMITNIDDNIGALLTFLKREGLYENTLIIFMTDNGTSAGASLDASGFVRKGYNAGMRGMKASPYEGGHRVPFFMLWENGNIRGGKPITTLSSFVDFLPTILDLCNVNIPGGVELDGMSLMPLMLGNDKNWPERTIVIDTQREEYLNKGKRYAVMTDRWRLVTGNELFDINLDPGQKNNVIEQYPNVRDQLLKEYDLWWDRVSVNQHEYQYAKVGGGELPLALTAHDCHMDSGLVAFSQERIRRGIGDNGFWTIAIPRRGKYRFELRRWPRESKLALSDAAPEGDPVPGGNPYPEGLKLFFNEATIEINNMTYSKRVRSNAKKVVFRIRLDEGNYKLVTWMTEKDGNKRGAYYVYIK